LIQKSKIANEKYRYKKSNIKTLLIDLYGSKEVFLQEYENIIAENILYFKNINLVQEFENVKFLKRHLKSSHITRCNILQEDLNTSASLIRKFRSMNEGNEEIDFKVASKSFWPINY